MIARIKKNDMVQVLSGKDKGKQGVVLEVAPKIGKVVVKGVGMVTRHVKARRQGEIAGIKKQEKYIDLSLVMPICKSCKKPCRVNVKTLESGDRARTCNRCQEIF